MSGKLKLVVEDRTPAIESAQRQSEAQKARWEIERLTREAEFEAYLLDKDW